MIIVRHNPDFIDLAHEEDDQAKMIAGYRKSIPVAKIISDDLEDAYAWTQNVFQSWTQNTGVKTSLTRCRSTSVGDFLVTKDGRVHMVAAFGFVTLEGVIG